MHYTTIENNRDIFCKDKIQPTYIFTWKILTRGNFQRHYANKYFMYGPSIGEMSRKCVLFQLKCEIRTELQISYIGRK